MRARPALLPVLAAVVLAGCIREFTPPSVLDGLRVLSLVAEPPEAGPGAPYGFSGLRVHGPINRPDYFDEYVVTPAS